MKEDEHYNRNKCNEENTIWLEKNLHEKGRTISQNLLHAVFHLAPVRFPPISFVTNTKQPNLEVCHEC